MRGYQKIEVEPDTPEIAELRQKLAIHNKLNPHNFPKDHCVSCENPIPIDMRRYKQSGNYCGRCCTNIYYLTKSDAYLASNKVRREDVIAALPNYSNFNLFENYDLQD